MKLKDVFNAVGDRTDWIRFNWSYDIVGGKIIPISTCDEDITLDSDVEIGYQWFHHCHSGIDVNEISNAITDHQYETFYKWYNLFEYEPFTYLPCDADIYIGDKWIGSVCVAYDPQIFTLITWEDHECG